MIDLTRMHFGLAGVRFETGEADPSRVQGWVDKYAPGWKVTGFSEETTFDRPSLAARLEPAARLSFAPDGMMIERRIDSDTVLIYRQLR